MSPYPGFVLPEAVLTRHHFIVHQRELREQLVIVLPGDASHYLLHLPNLIVPVPPAGCAHEQQDGVRLTRPEVVGDRGGGCQLVGVE